MAVTSVTRTENGLVSVSSNRLSREADHPVYSRVLQPMFVPLLRLPSYGRSAKCTAVLRCAPVLLTGAGEAGTRTHDTACNNKPVNFKSPLRILVKDHGYPFQLRPGRPPAVNCLPSFGCLSPETEIFGSVAPEARFFRETWYR